MCYWSKCLKNSNNGHRKVTTQSGGHHIPTCRCQVCHCIRLGLIEKMKKITLDIQGKTAQLVKLSSALETMTTVMRKMS